MSTSELRAYNSYRLDTSYYPLLLKKLALKLLFIAFKSSKSLYKLRPFSYTSNYSQSFTNSLRSIGQAQQKSFSLQKQYLKLLTGYSLRSLLVPSYLTLQKSFLLFNRTASSSSTSYSYSLAISNSLGSSTTYLSNRLSVAFYKQ